MIIFAAVQTHSQEGQRAPSFIARPRHHARVKIGSSCVLIHRHHCVVSVCKGDVGILSEQRAADHLGGSCV